MSCLFFMTVSVMERCTAKMNAPFGDLNCSDTFFTFIFLMALSEALLSGGTFGW